MFPSPGMLAAAAVLGLVVGSFLNVVIRRLPAILEYRWGLESREATGVAEEAVTAAEPPPSLARPPSFCPACSRRLRPWHKIPVISYLALRGRCGFCNARISGQYPTVELLSALVSVLVVMHFGFSFQSVAALFFSWLLIAAAFIDGNEQLLPDELTLPLLWGGLVANAFGLFTDAASAVVGAAAGYGGLWLIYQAMRAVTGREGLGYGDMKLFAATCAWCGWQALPLILLTASISGLAVSAVLLLAHKMKRSDRFAFGPYLAAAGGLAFFQTFVYQWPLPFPLGTL